jgi:hypothetical protein
VDEVVVSGQFQPGVVGGTIAARLTTSSAESACGSELPPQPAMIATTTRATLQVVICRLSQRERLHLATRPYPTQGSLRLIR